jgi:hypothetical protein
MPAVVPGSESDDPNAPPPDFGDGLPPARPSSLPPQVLLGGTKYRDTQGNWASDPVAPAPSAPELVAGNPLQQAMQHIRGQLQLQNPQIQALAVMQQTQQAAQQSGLDATANQVLDHINQGESAGYSDPAHLLYGGGHFGHPNISQPGPQGPTTAAGQGQWLTHTWDAATEGWMKENPKGGTPDFNNLGDQRKVQ